MSAWTLIVWTALPAGGVLVALFCSGHSLAMWLASKVLSAPLNVGTLQLSLGSVSTAFSIILSIIAYSGVKNAEARSSVPSPLRETNLKDFFFHGRNLYISLLSTVLWATAWRMKALYDARVLGPPANVVARRFRSPLERGCWAIIGILALLVADIPLCRINYNMMLAHAVTPRKHVLLETQGGACDGFKLSTAGGNCAQFCEDVRQLSQERLETIKWARRWHVLGHYAAVLFDAQRGVEQGGDRIDDIFKQKSCTQVLRSVDKSNRSVNLACYLCATISVMGSFAAFAKVFTQHEDRDHQD